MIPGLLYHREKHTSVIVIPRKDEKEQIFKICHDDITSGHLSLDRTEAKVASTAWWPKWNEDTESNVVSSTPRKYMNIIRIEAMNKLKIASLNNKLEKVILYLGMEEGVLSN